MSDTARPASAGVTSTTRPDRSSAGRSEPDQADSAASGSGGTNSPRSGSDDSGQAPLNPELGEPSERGRLDVQRTVLRKIAEHAADNISDSTRSQHRFAGVGLGEHGATARLSGPDQELRVQLDVSLRYPAPVREAVRSMRENVAEELGRLAGCRVRAVDVTVSALVAPESPRVE